MYKLKPYILSLLAILSFSMIAVAQANNQIEGRVITENNTPVNNAYVELYNDFDFPIQRTRSSSQGRFSFRGLRPGRYNVIVKPYGTNLLEKREPVEIQDLGTMPFYENINVILEVDKRFTQSIETIVGTIYAQEIPDEAKRLFVSGTKKLDSQDYKGVDEIEAAIKLFPTYFDALSRLGREYIAKGEYTKAYPYLLRAIDVYRQCAECYYGLAVAFNKLDQSDASVKAARAAVTLKPNSGDTQLLLGILLLKTNNYVESEKALTEAKKYFKDPNPDVHWNLAELYSKTKRNNEAVDELELYLKADPKAKNKEHVKKVIKDYRNKAKEEKP